MIPMSPHDRMTWRGECPKDRLDHLGNQPKPLPRFLDHWFQSEDSPLEDFHFEGLHRLVQTKIPRIVRDSNMDIPCITILIFLGNEDIVASSLWSDC